MYTYHLDYTHPTRQHCVLDPRGTIVLRTRIKYVALERVDLENRAVSMRKCHELAKSRAQVA